MRQALEIALEALEKIAMVNAMDYEYQQWAKEYLAAIKEALAQPEQEPVAFYVYKPTLPRGHLGNVSDGDLPWVYDQDPSSGYSARMLVYTTPPQRTWVGLTDGEIGTIAYNVNPLDGIRQFSRAIEAKLKEKNA